MHMLTSSLVMFHFKDISLLKDGQPFDKGSSDLKTKILPEPRTDTRRYCINKDRLFEPWKGRTLSSSRH